MEVQKADGVLKEVKWRQKSEIGATTFPLEIILHLSHSGEKRSNQEQPDHHSDISCIGGLSRYEHVS